MFLIRHEHHHHLDPWIEALLRSIDRKLDILIEAGRISVEDQQRLDEAYEKATAATAKMHAATEPGGTPAKKD